MKGIIPGLHASLPEKYRTETSRRHASLKIAGKILLSIFLIMESFSPTAVSAEDIIEVGVAWEGSSMMPERVLQGIKKEVSAYQSLINLEIRRDLDSISALEKTITDFEESKSAMIILRSSGAKLLGERGVSIPAFIGAANNPVELGAAYSFDKPKPNISGVTYYIPALMKLEAFTQVYPSMRNFILLVEEGHPSSNIDDYETSKAAPALGLHGRTVYCGTIDEAVTAIERSAGNASIIIGSQALLIDNAEILVEAAGNRPVFSYSQRPVEAGALAGIVADDDKLGRILGSMLIDLLIGDKPVDEMSIQTDPEPRLHLNPVAVEQFKDRIPFAVKSLARTEQMLETIMQTAPTGIGVVENREFVEVNDYVLDLTGYTREELTGRSARMLYPTEEEFNYVGQEKYRQIAEKGTGSVETRWHCKDGSIRHVLIYSTPLDRSDLSAGVTFTVLDITERKKAEAALAFRTRWFMVSLSVLILILLGLITWLVFSLRQRKAAEDKIKKQLSEKETLLREIHHRVKNNINHIRALLSLQANSSLSCEVKSALDDAASRVQSMGVLYDRLLITGDYTQVSIKNYAEGLIRSLLEVFPESSKAAIDIKIEDFIIETKKAVALGIILNELLTNVFKYAFQGLESGKLSINIEKTDNTVTLAVSDDGIGIQKAEGNQSTGFGLTIVKMLTEQLKGSYTVENTNGTKSVLKFEI